MKQLLSIALCLMLVGCATTKPAVTEIKKPWNVSQFADVVTQAQTQKYKVNAAQTRHILKIANQNLDGKLYQLIKDQK